MSAKNVKKFQDLLSKDSNARDSLLKCNKEDFSSLAVELGQKHGIDFTEEDIIASIYAGQKLLTENQIREMSRQVCVPSAGGLMELLMIHHKENR